MKTRELIKPFLEVPVEEQLHRIEAVRASRQSVSSILAQTEDDDEPEQLELDEGEGEMP